MFPIRVLYDSNNEYGHVRRTDDGRARVRSHYVTRACCTTKRILRRVRISPERGVVFATRTSWTLRNERIVYDAFKKEFRPRVVVLPGVSFYLLFSFRDFSGSKEKNETKPYNDRPASRPITSSTRILIFKRFRRTNK